MAIKPTKNGGYGPLFVWGPGDVAQVDEKLSTYGLDSQGIDVVLGPMSLQQEPTQPTIHPTITISTSIQVAFQGAECRTTNGGRIVLGSGDVPIYSTPRSRTVLQSFLEGPRSKPEYFGGGSVADAGNVSAVDLASGGVYQEGQSSGTVIDMPIAVPHDAATLTFVRVYFYIPTLPGSVAGSDVPAMIVYSRSTTANTFALMGSASVAAPSSAIAWYAGGAVQSFFAPITTGGLINLATNKYGVQFSPGTISSVPPVFLAMEFDYTLIADSSFNQ